MLPAPFAFSFGSAEAQRKAAAALAKLAVHNVNNQVAIARAGGIRPLVALSWRGSPTARRLAAATLSVLAAHNDDLMRRIVPPQHNVVDVDRTWWWSAVRGRPRGQWRQQRQEPCRRVNLVGMDVAERET